jgi:hypothetical protein
MRKLLLALIVIKCAEIKELKKRLNKINQNINLLKNQPLIWLLMRLKKLLEIPLNLKTKYIKFIL